MHENTAASNTLKQQHINASPQTLQFLSKCMRVAGRRPWRRFMRRVGAFPAISHSPLTRLYTDQALRSGHDQNGAGVNGLLLGFGAANRWESLQTALGYI